MNRLRRASKPRARRTQAAKAPGWLPGLLVAAVLAAGGNRPVTAQETGSDAAAADSEAVIEQILELRAQLEALLSALPPELRDEVERRWQARIEATTGDAAPPEAATVEAPEVTPEPDVAIASSPEADTSIEPEAAAKEIEQPADAQPTTEQACVHLAVFDTNGDRVVSSGDRYWRYLRLWNDNGDGVVNEELEIDSLFELGIRHIRVELDYYSLPEDVTGDIELGEQVRFVMTGLERGASSALLVVQAERMSRGGEVRLADASGEPLIGYQPISSSIIAETEDGRRLPLVCR